MDETGTSTILLLRHGETAANAEGRYIGRSDLLLTEKGRLQAARAAERARFFAPALCLASPLGRARQTAGILCAALGARLEVDEDLREIDFGRWEAKTFAEIAAMDPEAVNRWAGAPEDFAFPEGESLRDFSRRVGRAGARLLAVRGGTVAVVTHGGVVRHLLCRFLGLDERHALAFDIRPGALAVVRMTDGLGVLAGLFNQE